MYAIRSYYDMKKAACAEYAEKYGPLTTSAVNNTQIWTWVNDPIFNIFYHKFILHKCLFYWA